jgi:hypothetical protein
MRNRRRIGPPLAVSGIRGRIPIDDFHKSASEGEGACSKTSAGRSHLPLRGKLGWMTPRPGQKKTGKRNASLGLSFPSEGPFPFLARANVWPSDPADCNARLHRPPKKSPVLWVVPFHPDEGRAGTK